MVPSWKFTLLIISMAFCSTCFWSGRSVTLNFLFFFFFLRMKGSSTRGSAHRELDDRLPQLLVLLAGLDVLLPGLLLPGLILLLLLGVGDARGDEC